jgi:hypothetical protein
MSDNQIGKAVLTFWNTRSAQGKRQGTRTGQRDAGSRTAVTGGHQMDGFADLVASLLVEQGIQRSAIHSGSKCQLPGYYRAEKEWDLVVVDGDSLVAVVEFKSQVGSFGNNFNNRTEEAIGSAADIWTAYRESAFDPSPRPWLGYLMLLQDVAKVHTPVSVREPHFDAFDDFRDASYAQRYELLLRRLVRERMYDSACLLLSPEDTGIEGKYSQPHVELTFERLAASLAGHVHQHLALKRTNP